MCTCVQCPCNVRMIVCACDGMQEEREGKKRKKGRKEEKKKEMRGGGYVVIDKVKMRSILKF